MSTTSEVVVGTITFNYEVTEEMVCDILTTAFADGIGEWCEGLRIVLPQMAFGDAALHVAKGGEIRLRDDEDWHSMSRDEVLYGMSRVCQDRSIDPETLHQDHDAEMADAVVQYAIFNAIVFG